jgi:hypothetical protein
VFPPAQPLANEEPGQSTSNVPETQDVGGEGEGEEEATEMLLLPEKLRRETEAMT